MLKNTTLRSMSHKPQAPVEPTPKENDTSENKVVVHQKNSLTNREILRRARDFHRWIEGTLSTTDDVPTEHEE